MFRWVFRFEERPKQGVQLEAMILLVGICAAALAGLFVVTKAQSFPCFLREATGIPCPSCGGTRAFRALVSGNLREAFHFNPLATIGMFLSLIAVGYSAGVILRMLPAWRPIMRPQEWGIIRLLGVGLIGLNEWYLIRNLP
jgi:hypothetical protein